MRLGRLVGERRHKAVGGRGADNAAMAVGQVKRILRYVEPCAPHNGVRK